MANLSPVTSLDLALPWVLSQGGSPEEAPEASPPLPRLGRRNLFLLASRECYRSGSLAEAENQLLQGLQRLLKIPTPDAVKIAAVARGEANQGRLSSRPFDGEHLFLKAADLAVQDGAIDAREQSFLLGLAHLLGFDGDRVQDLMGRLDAALRSSRTPAAPGEAGPSPTQLLADAERFGGEEVEGGMSTELSTSTLLDDESGIAPACLSADEPSPAAEEGGPVIECGASSPPDTPAIDGDVPSVDPMALSATSEKTQCWFKHKGKSSKWAKKTGKQKQVSSQPPGGSVRTAANDPMEWLKPALLGGLGLVLMVLAL